MHRWLTVSDANLHNLQNVTAQVPLSRLVAVTGVSGSGKSTLARDVLLANVHTAVQKRSTKAGRDALTPASTRPGPVASASPASSRRPRAGSRSNPHRQNAALLPRHLHRLLGHHPQAVCRHAGGQARGYAANRFSFNTGEGRCPGCEGQGMRTIAMSFLPDVKVLCETCHGARFNPETLAVTWRGKNIGDVLQMEVDEAVEFFAAMPNISHPLQLLKDVGLGYLTLGQPSPTQSAARRSASSW